MQQSITNTKKTVKKQQPSVNEITRQDIKVTLWHIINGNLNMFIFQPMILRYNNVNLFRPTSSISLKPVASVVQLRKIANNSASTISS